MPKGVYDRSKRKPAATASAAPKNGATKRRGRPPKDAAAAAPTVASKRSASTVQVDLKQSDALHLLTCNFDILSRITGRGGEVQKAADAELIEHIKLVGEVRELLSVATKAEAPTEALGYPLTPPVLPAVVPSPNQSQVVGLPPSSPFGVQPPPPISPG